MTENEKDKIIEELKTLTHKYFDDVKRILNDNALVYAPEQKTMFYNVPFEGFMPDVNNDMVEDLCLDIVNNPDCVHYSLHEQAYVAKKLAEYEDYHSPKSRIRRHMIEIARLKEKYHVTDEDLK